MGSTAVTPSARGSELLETLLRLMGFDAEVDAIEREENVELVIGGEDASLAVGQKGQTLDALQYLVNRGLTRELGEHKLMVVNAEGYRERREASLIELAERLSEKALSAGKIVALDPMSARDRRVIHMALRDVAGIETRSEGEGDDRRLLIVPQSDRA
ncbi:MAG: KH domain-containing protein [Proteobacteria bacterium]|nr:KH domain-containing protein [Pseudomonadota bacterium]